MAAALTAAPRLHGQPRPARSARAAAYSRRLAPGAPAPPAGLGMRLARLLRGGTSVRPLCAVPCASRSLASASGSGPASELGVPGQVDFYARFSPSPLSMKQFLDFGEGGRRASVHGPGPPRRTPPPSSCRPLPLRLRCFLPPRRERALAGRARNRGLRL